MTCANLIKHYMTLDMKLDCVNNYNMTSAKSNN